MANHWKMIGRTMVFLAVVVMVVAMEASWEDPERETTETPTVSVVDGASSTGKECVYEEDLKTKNDTKGKEEAAPRGNVTKLDLLGAPDGVVESRPLRKVEDLLKRLENMTRPTASYSRRRGRGGGDVLNAALTKALDTANNATRRRALARTPTRHWEEVDGNLVLIPDRNYIRLAGENLTFCLSCLARGEVMIIYPDPTNVLKTKLFCDLPGNIFASASISIVYKFFFHLHECRQLLELKLHITEDLLFYHPFSVYRNLKRPIPIASPLPRFSDVGNVVWKEINRIVRFPFHRSLLRVYPRNFADAHAVNASSL